MSNISHPDNGGQGNHNEMAKDINGTVSGGYIFGPPSTKDFHK